MVHLGHLGLLFESRYILVPCWSGLQEPSLREAAGWRATDFLSHCHFGCCLIWAGDPQAFSCWGKTYRSHYSAWCFLFDFWLSTSLVQTTHHIPTPNNFAESQDTYMCLFRGNPARPPICKTKKTIPGKHPICRDNNKQPR